MFPAEGSHFGGLFFIFNLFYTISMAEIDNEALKQREAQLKALKKNKLDAEILNKAERARCYKEYAHYILLGEGGKVRVVDTRDYSWTKPVQEAKVWLNLRIYEYTVYQDKVTGQVEIREKPHEFVHQWIKTTRRYETIIFDPKKHYGSIKTSSGAYVWNRWNGFPKKAINKGSCQLFYDYLLDNISDGSQEKFDYIFKWLADMFQHPERKNNISLVLSSQMQGSGKSTFGDIICKLTEPYSKVIGTEELVGRFNDYMRDKIFIFVDENLFYRGRNVWNKLKKLITDTEVDIESKGLTPITTSNYMRFMFAANEEITVGLETDNRRYQTMQCAEKKLSKDDRDKMVHQLEHGGYEKLMWDLMHEPVDNIIWMPKVLDESYVTNRLNTLQIEHPAWFWLYEALNDSCKQECNPFYSKWRDDKKIEHISTKSNYTPTVQELYDKFSVWALSAGIFRDNISDKFKFDRDLAAILDDVSNHANGRKRDCSDRKIEKYKKILAEKILKNANESKWLFAPISDQKSEMDKEKLENKTAIEALSLQAVGTDNVKDLTRLKNYIERALYSNYLDFREANEVIYEGESEKDRVARTKVRTFIEWKQSIIEDEIDAQDDRREGYEAIRYKRLMEKMNLSSQNIYDTITKDIDDLSEQWNETDKKIRALLKVKNKIDEEAENQTIDLSILGISLDSINSIMDGLDTPAVQIYPSSTPAEDNIKENKNSPSVVVQEATNENAELTAFEKELLEVARNTTEGNKI
jgi:hypothetical protein